MVQEKLYNEMTKETNRMKQKADKNMTAFEKSSGVDDRGDFLQGHAEDTDADPEVVVGSDSNVTAMPMMLLQTKAKYSAYWMSGMPSRPQMEAYIKSYTPSMESRGDTGGAKSKYEKKMGFNDEEIDSMRQACQGIVQLQSDKRILYYAEPKPGCSCEKWTEASSCWVCPGIPGKFSPKGLPSGRGCANPANDPVSDFGWCYCRSGGPDWEYCIPKGARYGNGKSRNRLMSTEMTQTAPETEFSVKKREHQARLAA